MFFEIVINKKIIIVENANTMLTILFIFINEKHFLQQ